MRDGQAPKPRDLVDDPRTRGPWYRHALQPSVRPTFGASEK